MLNDCKYGYRVTKNCISANLLRSQDNPGKKSDRGHHSIRFALYPHSGDEIVGGVQKAAYEYNVPVYHTMGNGNDYADENYFSVSDNIIVDTVKPAENADGTVVRLFEPNGKQVSSTVTVPAECRKAFITDLREKVIESIKITDNRVNITFKPFEVITLKFQL